MLKLLTIYFLTFFTNLTFGQTVDTFKISGTVVSLNTGKPIPGGSIILSKDKATSCNSLGQFTIGVLTPGRYNLSFRISYFDKKDTIISIIDRNIDNLILRVNAKCNNTNGEKALKDIKKGKPKFFVGHDLTIVQSNDKEFQSKYGVTFNYFGFTAPPEECMRAYNQTVFEYLDTKFGKQWRNEVRQDVIGLRPE